MTPEYLEELAASADPGNLWRRDWRDRLDFTPEQTRRLDTGVALRCHAVHLERLRKLLGTGKSMVLTPLSPSSTDFRIASMPEEIKKRLKRENSARREPPNG